jgi:hypothetical protein
MSVETEEDTVKILTCASKYVTKPDDRYAVLVQIDKNSFRVVESWCTKEGAERALASLSRHSHHYGLDQKFIVVDREVVPVILK